MTAMPQLQQMQWDFLDRLLMTQRQAVNAADADGTLHQGRRTYYVYNAGGDRCARQPSLQRALRSNGSILAAARFTGSTTGGQCDAGAPDAARDGRQRTHSAGRDRDRGHECHGRFAARNHHALPIRAITWEPRVSNSTKLAAVISYEEYYPYGSTSYQAGRSVAEVSLKRYRYTGKEKDEETGFYYHGARYYAPWLGRWTSCDPAGLVDGPNYIRICEGKSRAAPGSRGDFRNQVLCRRQ